MAKRLNVTRRRWLLSAHILLSVAWFGAALCLLALTVMAAGTTDGASLQFAYRSFDLLDRTIVRPLAVGGVVSGILLSLLTQWGLFDFYWLMAKEVLTVMSIGLGVAMVNRTPQAIVSILSSQGSNALQNSAYQSGRDALLVCMVFQVVSLAAMVAISVFKPWGRRTERTRRTTSRLEVELTP